MPAPTALLRRPEKLASGEATRSPQGSMLNPKVVIYIFDYLSKSLQMTMETKF